MGRRFALVPIAALLAGCAAGFTSGIKRIEPYDPASAYIYGRFSLKGPQGERPGGTMGFEIQCRDGSTYTVGMKVRDSLQVIKVAPAACQIDQFVYATGRSIAERQPATFRLLRNELLDSGGVYYVGDFLAVSSSSSMFLPWYSESHFHWALASIRNDYETTTQEMKRKFPAFANVKTENRM